MLRVLTDNVHGCLIAQLSVVIDDAMYRIWYARFVKVPSTQRLSLLTVL